VSTSWRRFTWAEVNNPRALDVHPTWVEDEARRVDRYHDGISDQQAHRGASVWPGYGRGLTAATPG
jgi:hypothetical protein